MLTIWKFPLYPDVRPVPMPRGARLLSVGKQVATDPRHAEAWPPGEAVFLWAMVDPEAPTVTRRICVGGTGHNYVPEWGESPFLGTVSLLGGHFIVHVFDGGEVGEVQE